MMNIYEAEKRNPEFLGCWGKITGIFDHLRKVKLGKNAKYNLNEAFTQIFGVPIEKKNAAQFRSEVLKIVTPIYYVSKRNRRYAYFTHAQVNRLKRHFKKPENHVKVTNPRWK
jgi:hypothetical protein